MENFNLVFCVLVLFYITCNHVLARPDQMTSMTTEEPKMTDHSAHMNNMTESDGMSDEDNSNESTTDNTEDADSGEEKITVDSKSEFSTCPERPGDLANIESQCMAEYKAMKKAKCNTTEDDKMKKMGSMESMESGHTSHMGKRDVPMDDHTDSTDPTSTSTTTMKPMRHRKRSCHYYQCILKKLDVLDETSMLPNEEMFKTWVSNNVTEENEKTALHGKVMECFKELHDAGFYNTENSKSEEVSTDVRKGKTSCNAALKLLKCLSKQEECPAFKFP